MSRIRSTYIRITAAVGLVLAIAAFSFAKTHSDPAFANIKIKNFGQMDDRFYRGAQPKDSDFKDLAALGVKTVIDLRDDPQSYEKGAVEAAGMHYVSIPMSDTVQPKPEQVSQFLKVVDDPATGKFFLHCAGGKHRTGIMGAVYRFTHDHWNYDQVYTEMKDYNFSTAWGHGAMKDFVQDYWTKIQATPSAASAVSTSTTK